MVFFVCRRVLAGESEAEKKQRQVFLIFFPFFLFNQPKLSSNLLLPVRPMLAPRSLAGRRAVGRGSARRGTARSATSAASSSSPSQSSSSSAAAAAAAKKAKALPSLCQISFPLSFSLARARLACSPRLPVACNGSSSSDNSRDVSIAATSAAAADGGAGSGTTPSSATSASSSSAPTTTATSDAKTQPPPPPPQLSAGLKPFHLAAFVAVLGAGLAFLAVLLYFTAGIQFNLARDKVVKRLLKTVALRQASWKGGRGFEERGREKKKREERRETVSSKKKKTQPPRTSSSKKTSPGPRHRCGDVIRALRPRAAVQGAAHGLQRPGAVGEFFGGRIFLFFSF